MDINLNGTLNMLKGKKKMPSIYFCIIRMGIWKYEKKIMRETDSIKLTYYHQTMQNLKR